MKLFNKKMLAAVVTLSAASVYYAQEVQDTLTKSTDIEQVVLTGVADIAKDRKTPVAVSTIKEAQIVEKMGNQEFPEILNTTPSVYATKAGGGFGDSKINIRGFAQENIAVMVNGMPVNDMENSAVYWSNWAGLSDVTSALQVQRGLGSSKLAIASVGGTINIITRAADKKEGGNINVGVANDGYLKTGFAYNTGKSASGWAASLLFSRTAGSMYADGTQFEGYNYYFALGYRKNKHDFQFTMTGAPQYHNQRTTYSTIANYIKYNGDNDGTPNTRYNADWGYYKGREMSNRVNYYHKPIMSLNWDWKISEKSKLNSVFYGSFGRGGGTGDLGSVRVGTTSYNVTSFPRTAEGTINYDGIFAANAAIDANTAGARSTLIRRASINSHNWYGAIISFNHKINDNWNFTIGTDDRYYYGYHYQVVSDFYGANGYKDTSNQNGGTANPANGTFVAPSNVVTNFFKPYPNWNPFGGKINDTKDMVAYNNDGEVLWYGGFGQLEFSNDNFSAFVQGAVSNQGFQRIDSFLIDGQTLFNGQVAGYATSATNPTVIQASATNPALNTKTGFKNIFGYNVKAGANYNINEQHNVFANVGYYSKQPFFNAVYPGNKNLVNPNLTNEKIFGAEIGYGFRASWLTANLNAYRTSWKDRFLRRTNLSVTAVDPSNPNNTITYTDAYANVNGVTEIHQGIEFDAVANINEFISLTGMASYGDWFYEGNATSEVFNASNERITVAGNNTSAADPVYLDGVKVGGSAQQTAAAGIVLKPFKWFSVDGTYRGVRKLYANINPISFTTQRAGLNGSLELPTFGLLDLGMTLRFKLKEQTKQEITFRGNVYNVLDKVYIAESNTNILGNLTQADFQKTVNGQLVDDVAAFQTYQNVPTWNGVKQTNQVYFGYGRTWAASVTFSF